MLVDRKFKWSALVIFLVAVGLQPTCAQAISLEVAKKCNALLAKEFPPRQAGNPAAGSSKGSAKDGRDYYRKCVENGGDMDSAAAKK